MEPPRGRLRWLLLLWAAGSGLLVVLYSALEPHPSPGAQARNTTLSRGSFRLNTLNFGTRKGHACPRPLRQAIQQHRHFRGLFNLSAPVLLWGGLLGPELWDSLSRHKAPYGWQNLSRQAITSTLNLLNSSESAELFAAPGDLPRPCIRCAVVGNGGILNGSRQGRNIDAHNFVFRLNGAVVEGFEHDVGAKTSFYGFTVNTMKNSLYTYWRLGFTSVPQGQDLRYIFIPSDIRDYLMLRSAILGVPVPEGPDKADRPPAPSGRRPPCSRRPRPCPTARPPRCCCTAGRTWCRPCCPPPSTRPSRATTRSRARAAPCRAGAPAPSPCPRCPACPSTAAGALCTSIVAPRPDAYFGPHASARKFKLLHPAFISYVTKRFLKSKLINTNFGDLYMPSTGALMLLTALHTCDQVSAYGFITSDYWKYSDHYFDREKQPLVFYINHDLPLEATLWRDLHKAGILWLYQR